MIGNGIWFLKWWFFQSFEDTRTARFCFGWGAVNENARAGADGVERWDAKSPVVPAHG